MDPLTIFGAAASTLQIIDVLAKSIHTLHSICAQWQDSDLALLSLTSQLGALSAALSKIQEWMDSESDEVHHRLVMDLNLAIKCCAILASKVHSEVEDLEKAPDGSLTSTAKARFMLKRKGVAELQGMIDRQTSTLTLLLTACNSKSLAKQQEILGASEVRKRMDKVQKDSSSLVSLVDSESFLSKRTRSSSKLSVLFDFDEELFTSRPYKAMIRKTVKFSIRSSRQNGAHPAGVSTRIPRGASTKASSRYSAIEEEGFQSEQLRMNLLLLGIGAASKTTFVKQMESIYGHKTSSEDADFWRNIIYDNLLSAVNIAGEYWNSLGLFYEYDRRRVFGEPIVSAVKAMQETGIHQPGFPEVFRAIFSDKIQPNSVVHLMRWQLRGLEPSGLPGKFDNLPDNLSYLLEHIDRICGPSYVPTSNDILHARVRTTGIHPYVLNVPEYGTCNLYDVGGERSERKKWTSILANNDMVLFMASMSSYDQALIEDNTSNQIEESLLLFQSLLGSRWLEKSEIILCFTKMDVFQRKVDTGISCVKDYFPDFEGPEGDFEATKQFFTEKFTDLVKDGKQLHIFYLDVTNIEEVRNVSGFVFGDGAAGSVPHFTHKP